MTDETETPLESSQEPIEPEQIDSPQEAAPEPADETPEEKQARLDKRFAALTRKRRDAERERDYWREQALSKQQQPQPEPPAATDPPPERPTLAQFEGDYEKFADALSAYTDERIAFDTRKREAAERKQREEAQQRERQAKLTERQQKQVEMIQKGIETYDDYEDYVFEPTLKLSTEMLDVASKLPNGHEVLYKLGKNPAEAARIHAMSTEEIAIEMTKLSVAQQPAPKRSSNAPPPPNPAKGSGDRPGDEGTPETAPTMEEYAKRYRAQIAKRRTG